MYVFSRMIFLYGANRAIFQIAHTNGIFLFIKPILTHLNAITHLNAPVLPDFNILSSLCSVTSPVVEGNSCCTIIDSHASSVWFISFAGPLTKIDF
jgi:hypothetical protein